MRRARLGELKRWLRWWLALATMLVVLAPPSPAFADKDEEVEEKARQLPRRDAKLENHKKWLALSVGWRDVVNKKIRRKLLSGLPTIIAVRVYVFPDRGVKSEPVVLTVQTCRVVYDLWDEVFRIELRRAGTKRKTVAVNVEGVLRRCGEVERLPLVAMKGLDEDEKHFIGVLVEVNPLSKEMLKRIKKWVSRPKGGGAVGPGDSLFGSFVGLFVTHVPKADRVLMFRTQSFVPKDVEVVEEKKKESSKKDDSS